MKLFYFSLLYACFYTIAYAQDQSKTLLTDSLTNSSTTQWLSFKEAIERYQQEPKPILAFTRGIWCPCFDKVKSTVFDLPDIAQYLKEHFYLVHFMMQTKDTITLHDNTYFFEADTSHKHGGQHQLLRFLIPNYKSESPYVVFLDNKLNNPKPMPGRPSPNSFRKLIRFFGEEYNQQMEWGIFHSIYQYGFEDGKR